MSDFDDVGEFHYKFGLHSVTHDGVVPQKWNDELLEFRTKFMQEELDEWSEGVAEHDHAKMFDALIDLTYVAMGTAHVMGYPWEDGWAAVQRANMAKIRAAKDGSDSARGSAWDVVKPPGWKPPDIEAILERYDYPHDHGVASAPDTNPCPGCGADMNTSAVLCSPGRLNFTSRTATVKLDRPSVYCMQKRTFFPIAE